MTLRSPAATFRSGIAGIHIRGSAATNEVRRDLYLNHALQAIEPGVTSLVVCLTAMIDEIEA